MSLNYKLGAVPSPEDDRDFHISRLAPTVNVFPDNFLIPLVNIPYIHEVKNQDDIGACVAFSIVYCREIVEEKQNEEYRKFSTGFVYGNRDSSDSQGEGMYPREALKHLLNEGICDYDLMPINVEYPIAHQFIQENLETLMENAKPYKISAYARIYKDDEVMSALMQLGPVTVTIAVGQSLFKLNKQNAVYNLTKEPLLGYHEVTVVGWRTVNGQKEWIILNSWGEDWGDNGFFYFPLTNWFTEAWAITDKIIPNPDPIEPKYYRVFLGKAYKYKKSILKLYNLFVSKGLGCVMQEKDGHYQLQFGAYTSEENATKMTDVLRQMRIKSIIEFY